MQKQFHTKNQHYVPQFYLRNFSEDGFGLRTLNLSSGKIIPHAKLKCQCSKDYFYGEDGVLESALGGLETRFSIAFKNCLAIEHRKKKISDEQFYLLSLFAAVQYKNRARTRYIQEKLNDLPIGSKLDIGFHEEFNSYNLNLNGRLVAAFSNDFSKKCITYLQKYGFKPLSATLIQTCKWTSEDNQEIWVPLVRVTFRKG